MSRHVGVVMDPIDTINFKKDTTLGLLWSAQAMGWQLWYMEQADLFLRGGDGRAIMRPLQVAKDPGAYYTLGDAEDRSLAELDAIFMRKDPPFDM
ncbi:MAG: glutathione synthase, partial [Halieaceae bacterium]